MVNPLWNRHDGRLRAGWRIVALLAATTLASLVAFRFVAPLPFISPLGARVAYLVLAFLALWAAVRFLDRRPLRDLGLVLGAGWRRDLLAGFAVTGLVISLITVSFWSLGWVTLEGGSTPVPDCRSGRRWWCSSCSWPARASMRRRCAEAI